jgi:hypothetical protein
MDGQSLDSLYIDSARRRITIITGLCDSKTHILLLPHARTYTDFDRALVTFSGIILDPCSIRIVLQLHPALLLLLLGLALEPQPDFAITNKTGRQRHYQARSISFSQK